MVNIRVIQSLFSAFWVNLKFFAINKQALGQCFQGIFARGESEGNIRQFSDRSKHNKAGKPVSYGDHGSVEIEPVALHGSGARQRCQSGARPGLQMSRNEIRNAAARG
jgi:hypothetical protein